MDTNDTNQPETQPEPSQARCAVPICSASELIDSISWCYRGDTRGYHITMRGAGQIHFTKSDRDRDLFIAEMKARILLLPNPAISHAASDAGRSP